MNANFTKDDNGNIGVRATLNPFEYPTVECSKCHNITFKKVAVLKEVPGIAVGAGTDKVTIPMTVFACDKCGEILDADKEMLQLGDEEAKKESKNSPLIIT